MEEELRVYIGGREELTVRRGAWEKGGFACNVRDIFHDFLPGCVENCLRIRMLSTTLVKPGTLGT